MRELLTDLMDAAARHADYADARHVRTRAEHLTARNGGATRLDARESEGIGVRVRAGAGWGFAATRGTSRQAAEAALARALELAAAHPGTAGAALAPEPAAAGEWSSPAEIDPFAVALEGKLEVLEEASAALLGEPGVMLGLATFLAWRTDKLFASTEGALCEQHVTECGGELSALAGDGVVSQPRSYPASHGGGVALAGYEHFLGLDLVANAPRVAEEAAALLKAPACPQRRGTLILAGEQLGLQVHESVGHAVELDRVLGREASYAGTSFLAPDAPGKQALGSPLMNVTADATTPGGLGSFRWDDEGVEGQSLPIVRDGVLRGFLSSRETAAEIGLRALRGLHARRRLRAPADRADDEREPRARRRRHASTS